MAGDFNQERLTETYKSLITLSTEAFRYLALVNGGAVVALLAYLGNLTKNGSCPPDLSAPLLWFLGGLVSCGAAMAFAYVTQLRLLNELLSTGKLTTRHPLFLWVAMSAYLTSLTCFSYGSWVAVKAFQAA